PNAKSSTNHTKVFCFIFRRTYIRYIRHSRGNTRPSNPGDDSTHKQPSNCRRECQNNIINSKRHKRYQKYGKTTKPIGQITHKRSEQELGKSIGKSQPASQFCSFANVGMV